MGKLILLLLVALAAFVIFKGLKAPRGRQSPGRAADASPERMVTCERCGVHLPESDSVRDGGKYFCSEEHRRLDG
jgi:uncharacterized protein